VVSITSLILASTMEKYYNYPFFILALSTFDSTMEWTIISWISSLWQSIS